MVFGSSDTYGAGLSDIGSKTDHPSEFAWPNLLSKKLNVEVVNNAIPGASNKQIMLSILNCSNLQSSDLVIIVWTIVGRSCMLDKNNNIHQILPQSDDYRVELFFKLFDRENLEFESKIQVSHAHLFLQKKECKFHSLTTDYNLITSKVKLDLHEPVSLFPVAVRVDDTDDRHPGPISHQNYANAIMDRLSKLA
jgi:hypothetical protein